MNIFPLAGQEIVSFDQLVHCHYSTGKFCILSMIKLHKRQIHISISHLNYCTCVLDAYTHTYIYLIK